MHFESYRMGNRKPWVSIVPSSFWSWIHVLLRLEVRIWGLAVNDYEI